MGELVTASQYGYYAIWFLKSKLGAKRSLVNTMIINYNCDLRCEHCSIISHKDLLPKPHSISFADASRDMKDLYDKGARIVFFEGGEPTLWRDGEKDLRDLIREARSIGYFVTGYTTHGANVIYEESDVISISLDGPKEVHDMIRGRGVYDRLMANLAKTKHGNIFANMVVMKRNKDSVRETVELVGKHDRIKGIMLNFLTPPPNDIALTLDEKKKVVDLAIQMKKEGYPILNTNKALKGLLEEDFENRCPEWISAFVMPDRSRHYGCPMRHTESCKKCGFNAVREYRLIARGNIETIIGMSKRFALSKQE